MMSQNKRWNKSWTRQTSILLVRCYLCTSLLTLNNFNSYKILHKNWFDWIGGTKVKKTKWERIKYGLTLLNIVLFWPFWLKAICLKYKSGTVYTQIRNESIHVSMAAPALYASASPEECELCGASDVTYGVTLNITNYRQPASVTSASYVSLLLVLAL